METILGIEYPLTKLDLVAVPDFAAGAMENWGIITFRETDLLVPSASAPTKPSVMQLYSVPLVVAHEVAHMWFGAHSDTCVQHADHENPATRALQALQALPVHVDSIEACCSQQS
jgi:hypothetical protein